LEERGETFASMVQNTDSGTVCRERKEKCWPAGKKEGVTLGKKEYILVMREANRSRG